LYPGHGASRRTCCFVLQCVLAHWGLRSFPTRRSSDLEGSGMLCMAIVGGAIVPVIQGYFADHVGILHSFVVQDPDVVGEIALDQDRKSTRLNSSHRTISYAVFCLKKKKTPTPAQSSRC